LVSATKTAAALMGGFYCDRLLYELDEIRDVVSWRQVSDLAQLPCEIEEVDLDI